MPKGTAATEEAAGRIADAKEAALQVLLHNARGPYRSLPRTAGWGYPEPYTRDMMISALGFLATGNEELIAALRQVFEALAENQTERGHIPSLAHDPDDRGASDTTPLFLLALAIYRKVTGEKDFLEDAAHRALTWMDYQSPSDRVMVAQQPTSDWRDEQWVMGFGLFVNAVVYAYLKLFGEHRKAATLRSFMGRFTIKAEAPHHHVHEGLVVRYKPYYALWSYKIYSSERFDLLGNSLAVISGLAPPSRARSLIKWIERECAALRDRGDLVDDLPPALFPYIRPSDPDWHARYERFGQPGEYHNGGIWPFIEAFYVVAALTTGLPDLAAERFASLTRLVKPSRDHDVEYGFNEWLRAQDGRPLGQDWQTWSAAMYLYAAACVEQGRTLFFEDILPARKIASDR